MSNDETTTKRLDALERFRRSLEQKAKEPEPNSDQVSYDFAYGLAPEKQSKATRDWKAREVAEAHRAKAPKPEAKPAAPRSKAKEKAPPPKLGVIEKIELGFPETSANGKIKNTCENVRHAVKLMGITCEYDDFHDKLLIGGQPIGQYAGELTDHACLYLRKMIEERFDFDPLREKMFDACVQLALENRFDPIVDYLNALKWDGVGRIDTWLHDYCGAEDTELNRAIGRIALVAQVRRARQSGVKFDQIIVLESPEGWQKSTALSILAAPIISLIRRF